MRTHLLGFSLCFFTVTSCKPTTTTPDAPDDASVVTQDVVDETIEEVMVVEEKEVKADSRCPADMKYVSGKYCKSLRYKCVKGRNKNEGLVCPKGCYLSSDNCQEWLPGSAECLPTKAVKKNGKLTYEPEYIDFEFCMDVYEWPNKVGERPKVFISYYDAEKMCSSVGKRICTSSEFTLACEGPEQLPTGYGWKIDGITCNVNKVWKDWTKVRINTPEGFAKIDQSEIIGSRTECVSHYGIHDLTGNIDEWTKLDPIDKAMSGHPSQLKGGYYALGAHPYCRAHTDAHGPEFSFYQIGTRCCTDVKK